MALPQATKKAIDRALELATDETNGIPGVLYTVIDKDGNFIYEGAAGVRSLDKPESKASLLE